jgi:hypothetical protein
VTRQALAEWHACLSRAWANEHNFASTTWGGARCTIWDQAGTWQRTRALRWQLHAAADRAEHDRRAWETGALATRTCRPRLARCPDGPASRSARQRPPGEHSGPNQEPRGAPGGQTNARKNTTTAVEDKGRGLCGGRNNAEEGLTAGEGGPGRLWGTHGVRHLYFKVRRKQGRKQLEKGAAKETKRKTRWR